MLHRACEPCARGNTLRHLVVVLVFGFGLDVFVAARVLQCVSDNLLTRSEISVVLPDPQVAQALVAEEKGPRVVEMEVRVWVIGVSLDVFRIARCARPSVGHKLRRRPDFWAGRSHHMEAQQPVVRHAQTDGPALQEVRYTSPLAFQVIPELTR